MRWTAATAPTGQAITDVHQTQFASVADLYHGQDPSQLGTYRKRAEELDANFTSAHRTELVETLRPFLQSLRAPSEAMKQLERIADSRTVVVVAGQQAGLFTGPLYSIYKALSAVGMAKRLETELMRPVVPVFWIASEDHDWGEVDHAYLLDTRDEVRRVRLPESAELHDMVHSYGLSSESVSRVLQDVEMTLPDGQWRADVVAALHDTYEPGDSLVTWFGRLLYQMLGPTGIILLDPCLPGLRNLVGDVWKSAVEHRTELAANVAERYRQVEQRGYEPAVVRDPANTTLFYVQEGKRYVVERTDSHALLRVRGLGIVKSAAELVEIASADPASFSSNVLLRPVVQDFLLPTVAFVGGPSEIAYHALCGAVFETFGRKMPPLVLRDRLSVYPPSVLRNMAKWDVSMADVSAPVDLQSRVTDQLGGLDFEVACAEFIDLTEHRWNGWGQKWSYLGPQIQRMAEAQVQRETAGIRNATYKAKSLFARGHDTELRQLRHIERWLWTDGHAQERRLCPLNLWSKYGLDWLRELPIWGTYDAPGTLYHVEL